MVITKYIKSGNWRTVESFWNMNYTAFFREPSGARIKIRYGVGIFGFDSQKQTLDGANYKKLSIGGVSIAYARIQVKVSVSTNVTYELEPGNVAWTTPKIPF